MFDHKQYIPRLRWKLGEYQAVLRLSKTAKKSLTPLIEIPEIGWDFEENDYKKNIDDHLAPFAKRVHDKWGKSPCFIDLRLISPSERMANNDHPVKFIFDGLLNMKCSAIPIVRLDGDNAYQREIKRIIAQKKSSGICIAITIEQAAASTLKRNLDLLMSDFKIEASYCNLILDLEAPNFVPLEGFTKLILGIINHLPYLNKWETFSIIGTSFPESMGGIKEGMVSIPRYEWQLYKKLIIALKKESLRLPCFGDYAISHPNVLELDMRKVKPSATIRYTIDDNWYIVKGKNVKDYGLAQFHALSQNLVNSQYYHGPTFSYGDEYIQDCAKNKAGNGNLTTWRQVGTNRHIEKVRQDISSYYASLKSP